MPLTWGKTQIRHTNTDGKKAGVAPLIFNKVNFRTKKTEGDKEGHSIMRKGLICQEDITILNVYTSHNRASKTQGSKN